MEYREGTQDYESSPAPHLKSQSDKCHPQTGGFNAMISTLGRSGMCTCFFAIIMNVVVAFQTLSYVFFTFPYQHECVPNTIDKCDPSCTKIIFPKTKNVTNIISEWNLVCEKKNTANVSHFVYTAGAMIGSILYGHWSDQHGRRPCIISASFMIVVSGFLAAATPWYWLYCFIQFFLGFSAGGWNVVCMVLLVEFVPQKYRESVIIISDVPFFAGYCLLVAIVYVIPSWRYIQLLSSGMGIFSVAYIWILPESPRFLLLTGRIKQCAKVVEKLSGNSSLTQKMIIQTVFQAHADLRECNFAKTGYFFDIFKTRKLRKITLIIGFVWYTCYWIAFGQVFGSDYMEENIYATVAINAAIMLCGNLVAFPIINYLNRRTAHAFAFIFTAIWMFMSLITPDFANPFLNEVLSTLAISMIPTGYYNLVIFCTELYPTALRTSGIGFGFFCGEMAKGILDLIRVTNTTNNWLQPVVGGILALVCAFIIFLLPETKGSKLQEYLDDD